MKWYKKILVVGLIALVGIQFFPAKRNQSTIVLSSDFIQSFDVPTNIQSILKTSCYDCHSNNTNYPWYNKLQPVSWVLNHHIKEGKGELNFSEFGTYSKRKQKHKLEAIVNQIKDNEMPLFSYTLIHGEAKLSEQEKTDIVNWIKQNIN